MSAPLSPEALRGLPGPLRAVMGADEQVLWWGRPAGAATDSPARSGAFRLILIGLGAIALGVFLALMTRHEPGSSRWLAGGPILGGALLAGLALKLALNAHMRRLRRDRITYMLTNRAAYRFEAGIGRNPAAWDLTDKPPLLVHDGDGEWALLFDHIPVADSPTVHGVGFLGLAPDADLLAVTGLAGPQPLRLIRNADQD